MAGDNFKSSLIVAICVLIFCLAISFFFQFLFLPAFPELHDGNGLLKSGDFRGFHKAALVLLEGIKVNGLIEGFELRPDGRAPSSYAALIYYFTGIEQPWVLLFTNCIMFSICAFLLHIICSSIYDKRIAVFCLIPLVFFPSGILIYGQIHKDVFSMLGTFLLLYLMLSITVRKNVSLRFVFFVFLLSFIAGFFVWYPRPYLIKVYVFSYIIAMISFYCYKAINNDIVLNRESYFKLFIIILCVLSFSVFDSLPNESSKGHGKGFYFSQDNEKYAQRTDNKILEKVNSESAFQDKLLVKINLARRAFVKYKNAGSSIDSDFNFTTWSDVFSYIPRAIQIGYFSPFPTMWFDSDSVSTKSFLMRTVSSFETIMVYIFMLGFLGFLVSPKFRVKAFLPLCFSSIVVLIFGLVIANIGSLYRMRYGHISIISGIGICGWYYLFDFFIRNKIREKLRGHYE